MDIGWQEMAIILLIVVIIFGVGKLPEIGGSLGKGIREFRQAAQDDAPGTVVDTKATVPVEVSDSPSTVVTREEL
jgi:sec-independent protein translocase protein TatA